MQSVNNASPAHLVYIFIVIVVCLQLAYLILVRPTPSLHPPGEQIIGEDFVLLSTIKSYKPVKLNNLLDLRKDDTNSIILIFSNHKELKLTQNFLLECSKLKIFNYVIFALDNYTTCEKLEDNHCYFDASYNFTTPRNRDTYRINITTYLVQQGYNVFSSHKHVFLFDNPLLYFDRSVDINVLNEYPTSVSRAKSDPNKCCSGHKIYYDAGFFYIRSTLPSMTFLEEYYSAFVKSSISMQDAFNYALAKRGSLSIKVLSDIQFPNGFIAFWKADAIEPVAVHSNWGDYQTTVYRGRELVHWNVDDAERYSAPRQYITYTTEDDVVTYQIEKDFLQLTYLLAKLLNRNIILPSFHCYIDRPPKCFLDSIFSVNLTLELDIYENSFFSNPLIPPAHLQRAKLVLPDMDSTLKVGNMKELLFQVKGLEDVPLLEIQFPKVMNDGKHYSLATIGDRKARWDHELFVNQVENNIKFSNEIFANWTNFLPEYISDPSADYVCVITVSDEIDFLVSNLKSLKIEKPLYIISDNPAHSNSPNIYEIKESFKKVVFGFDALWSGHKLMQGHSAVTHLQMETCSKASEVIVNALGPSWLVGGVCSARRNSKKSTCKKLLRNPWEVSDAAKTEVNVEAQWGTKEREERQKIAKTHYGVVAIYPEKGPSKGGNKVTFVFSPELANLTLSNDWFGGCKFGSSEAPISGVTKYMDAFYLVDCYAPAHEVGEVEPVLMIQGESRLPFPGTIMYKYMTAEDLQKIPDPYLAMCTVFKNQAIYMREWISFHYMLGVKKFFMYDQGSVDDWKSTVQDFIDKGIIEFYQWDLYLKPSTRMQTIALWHCIQNQRDYISWIGLIDMDEFFVPVDKMKDRNISVILNEFDDTDIAQVYVDRVNYGPSGHDDRPKGLVAENYYWREPVTYSPVKSIVKPKHIVDTVCGGVHTFKVEEGKKSADLKKETRTEDCGRTWEPALQRLRINHYWSKSIEDFNEKLTWDGNPYQVSADELFQKWSNAVEDKILEQYLFDLKKQIKQKV